MSNYALISRCGYCFLRSGKKNCKQRARIHIGFHCFMEIVRFFIINIFLIKKKKSFPSCNLENGLDSQQVSCLNDSETQKSKKNSFQLPYLFD